MDARIEALKAEPLSQSVDNDQDAIDVRNAAIDRTAAIFQRQSAQPGSVERVEALTPEQSSVLVEAAELLDKAADYGGKNQSFGPYLPYIGASTKLRNLARTPATSDNEARVK